VSVYVRTLGTNDLFLGRDHRQLSSLAQQLPAGDVASHELIWFQLCLMLQIYITKINDVALGVWYSSSSCDILYSHQYMKPRELAFISSGTSQSCDLIVFCLLECNILESGKNQMAFRLHISVPSSGSKRRSSKEPPSLIFTGPRSVIFLKI
jgi:hypothetical protein